MSTTNFSAQSAQNNSGIDGNNGLIVPVYHNQRRTRRFFIYGVKSKEEAACSLNDYLTKKGVRFKPALVGDISDPMDSDYIAHSNEVRRLIDNPEDIEDGTGEPGKVDYLEEDFLVNVLRYITLNSVQKPKVLEYQSYTMIFEHRRVEFWAAESFAASMAREVLIREHLLDRAKGEKDFPELLQQLKDARFSDVRAKGLWLPTEMFLNSNGDFDKASQDRIFEDLVTKDPWKNLPIIHHTIAAFFSQKKVVKCMNFREFWRFLTAYLQPIIPSWLVEYRLYCIDFSGMNTDIEFYMYHRLDHGVKPIFRKSFPDLGITRDEADDAVKEYAAEHNGVVTVVDYTKDGDCDPYEQADKFVDFLIKATGADGIRDSEDEESETNFIRLFYSFLWVVKEIPNLEVDQLQEMAKGLKIGQIAKFLLNSPQISDIPIVSLVKFISQTKFLGAWCQLWYDPAHHEPHWKGWKTPELPAVSFGGNLRKSLKALFDC